LPSRQAFWSAGAGDRGFQKLASWLAIIAVPTAIAGIYGMNFKHMPELDWEYGYFSVIGTILLVCAGLFWRFRRVGWL
jgi:magnesium transporter